MPISGFFLSQQRTEIHRYMGQTPQFYAMETDLVLRPARRYRSPNTFKQFGFAMECEDMSNGLGLFNWIRDGVKQSVLLGVSDAIDTIGSHEDNRSLNPALLTFAKQPVTMLTDARIDEPIQRKVPGASGRKRLGRSLRDIDPKPAS